MDDTYFYEINNRYYFFRITTPTIVIFNDKDNNTN